MLRIYPDISSSKAVKNKMDEDNEGITMQLILNQYDCNHNRYFSLEQLLMIIHQPQGPQFSFIPSIQCVSSKEMHEELDFTQEYAIA